MAFFVIFFFLFYLQLVSRAVAIANETVSTSVVCKGECGDASLVAAGRNRTLGNKVSDDFEGTVSITSSTKGDTFGAILNVTSGQAWPRISVGIAVPKRRTEGYPVALKDYLKLAGLRYSISYAGSWKSLGSGEDVIYNGGQIWLNSADNYWDNGAPRWPFTVEVSVWNRYGDVFRGERYPPYQDADGNYGVYGGQPNNKTRAYTILNESNRNMSSMNINTIQLLRHLREHCDMPPDLGIIEMSAQIQGHARTNAQFSADIRHIGGVDALTRGEIMKIALTESANTKNTTATSGDNQKNDNSSDNGQPNWELIASIVGGVFTIAAALLTVYLSQGRCGRNRKNHQLERQPTHESFPPSNERFEYI